MDNKDARIAILENELRKFQQGKFSFADLSREIKVNYENVENLSYANTISTNFETTDTIPTFNIKWKSNVPAKTKRSDIEKIQKWLDLRLQLDTLAVQTQS